MCGAMRGAVIIVGGQEVRNPKNYATRIGPTRASGVASASSWMTQPKPKGALSSAKQNHPTCENLGARGGELMCGVRQDCGWRAGARGGAEVRRREGHRVEVRDGRARGLIVYLYGYYYYYTRGASHE